MTVVVGLFRLCGECVVARNPVERSQSLEFFEHVSLGTFDIAESVEVFCR